MNLMLAQTLQPPVEIAAWLACAAFVIMLVNGSVKMVRSLKDQPAPGEVRAEAVDRFVPKDTFYSHVNKNESAHEQIFSKIGGVERGTKSAIEQQVDGLRKDLTSCVRDISGLQKETMLQNQSLARVESKLDRLIERA